MRAKFSPLLIVIAMPLCALAQAGNLPSAEHGQMLYQKNMCFTCHGSAGNGGERTSGPQLAPKVWPVEAMKIQLRNPRKDMPRYREKFVSNSDLADIDAYLSTIKAGVRAENIPLLSAL